MREIKFRVWNKFEENFVDSDEYAVTFNGIIFKANLDSDTYNNLISNENLKIMQYTGLKDKNGVEIYEGDIIKIEKCFTNGVDKLSDHIGEIKYLNCRFMATDEYLNSLCPYTYKNQIEVIGNIYENSELLRED